MATQLNQPQLFRNANVLFEAAQARLLVDQTVPLDEFGSNLRAVRARLVVGSEFAEDVEEKIKVAHVDAGGLTAKATYATKTTMPALAMCAAVAALSVMRRTSSRCCRTSHKPSYASNGGWIVEIQPRNGAGIISTAASATATRIKPE